MWVEGLAQGHVIIYYWLKGEHSPFIFLTQIFPDCPSDPLQPKTNEFNAEMPQHHIIKGLRVIHPRFV